MKAFSAIVFSIFAAMLSMTGCNLETQKPRTAAEGAVTADFESADSKPGEPLQHETFKPVQPESQPVTEPTEPIEVDVDTLEMLKQLGRTWGVEQERAQGQSEALPRYRTSITVR